MSLIERSTDDLLAAINNLAGYRCAEQRAFLAHVEAVHRDVRALVTDHRGAVADAESAVRLLDNARTMILDSEQRHAWEAERARLRATYRGRYEAAPATDEELNDGR